MENAKYGSETADLKLLAILFMRKLWILAAAALAGGLIFGTVYFVKHVVLAPEPEYRTHSMLYVDFVESQDGTPKYYTFNTAGWAGFVKTDVIIDKAMPYLAAHISKEEVRDNVEAAVDSDYRVVELTVTSQSPETALDIAHAMEKAFVCFGDEMKECEQIRIMTSADKTNRVLADVHTLRAVIWGIILASVMVIFAMLLWVSLDDSVYLPITFERRFKIPMLGAVVQKGETDTEELFANLSYFKKEEVHFAIVGIGELSQEVKKELAAWRAKDEGIQILDLGKLAYTKEQADKLRQSEGVILDVPAGASNGKQIEKALSFLEKQNCPVMAALLSAADAEMLRLYYFGRKKR